MDAKNDISSHNNMKYINTIYLRRCTHRYCYIVILLYNRALHVLRWKARFANGCIYCTAPQCFPQSHCDGLLLPTKNHEFEAMTTTAATIIIVVVGCCVLLHIIITVAILSLVFNQQHSLGGTTANHRSTGIVPFRAKHRQ